MPEGKCDSCGIEAVEGEQFQVEKFPFRSQKWYCSNCYSRLSRRANSAFLLVGGFIGIVGLILIRRDPGSELGRAWFNLFLLEVFCVFAIVPHEFGHAIIGRVCGLKVTRIILGMGPNIWVGRIFGFLTEFKLIPAGGFAFAEPQTLQWVRTKWFLFIAAGPLTNLVALFLVHLITGVSIWPTFSIRASPAEVYVFANWIDLVVNLVPFVARTSRGHLPNDGLALAQILFLRRMPFVPTSMSLRRETIFRWVGALLLFIAALFCFYVGVFLARFDLLRARVLIGSVFGAVGFAFLWFSWRVLHERQSTLASARKNLVSIFLQELQPLGAECLRNPSWSQYQQHLSAKEWQNAEEALLRISSPEQNGFIAYALAEVREYQRDFAGAEQLLTLSENAFSPRAAVWIRLQTIKMQLSQGNVAAAKQTSAQLIATLTSKAERLEVMDRLACFPIMDGLRCFLDEADTISKEALALQPQNLTLKGTRGSILVELGRHEEAEALLNEVYSHSEADNDKGISAFYLGLIARAKGDQQRAKAWARKAKLLHPQEWLTKRVDAELLSSDQ